MTDQPGGAAADDHHDDDHLAMPLSPSLRSHPDDWINMLPFDVTDADLHHGPPSGGELVGLSVSVGSEGLHHPGGGGGGSNFQLGGQQQHDAHNAQQRHQQQVLDDEMMAAAVAAAVAATSTTNAAGAAGLKTTGEEDYDGYSDHSGLDMMPAVAGAGAGAGAAGAG